MQINYELIRSNSELRWLARNQLRGNWGNAVLVCIVYSLVIGAAQGILTGPLTLGLSLCFVRLSRGYSFRFEDLFEGFKRFGTGFLAYLLQIIFTILWSLLFIVPGILASLSYALTPYIINDNPGISAMDAIKTSKQMMKGFKWKLFCMNLSFIGWGILCIFTCGIGALWLTPYTSASMANFYEDLRRAYGMNANENYASNMGGYTNPNGFNNNFYGTNNTGGFNNNYNYNNNYNNANSSNDFNDISSYNKTIPNYNSDGTPNYPSMSNDAEKKD